MMKEVARYGTFRNRDEPKENVLNSTNKQVNKKPSPNNPDKWGLDIFNPFARYGI